jgi:hypothetical protein
MTQPECHLKVTLFLAQGSACDGVKLQTIDTQSNLVVRLGPHSNTLHSHKIPADANFSVFQDHFVGYKP